MIKGRRKIIKELDFIANELIEKCLVGRSRAVYEGINLTTEKREVIVILRAQLTLDKLPKPLDPIQIRTVGRDIIQVDIQMPGQFLNGLAFLVTGIVKHKMDFFAGVYCPEISEHFTNLCGSNVTVVGCCMYFFGKEIHGTKDIVAFTPRPCSDKSALSTIDTAEKVAAHNKMGRIQK